jgi:hypothetical protein
MKVGDIIVVPIPEGLDHVLNNGTDATDVAAIITKVNTDGSYIVTAFCVSGATVAITFNAPASVN